MNSTRINIIEKRKFIDDIKAMNMMPKLVYDITSKSSKSCYEIPENGMSKDHAFNFIKRKINRDRSTAESFGAFASPYVGKPVCNFLPQNLSKNFSDGSSYPVTSEIDTRCVNMVGRLFNIPNNSEQTAVIGCSTVGSTEAIILGTLAMKKRWQLNRLSKGLPISKPNFVIGTLCHCAYIKATKFFDIECRIIELSDDSYCIDPQKAIESVDENTIGVGTILGTTYTGHYDDIKTINDLLEKKCRHNNWDIGIHVDAASGGFIAPFTTPELEWDFRLSRVHSINVSGHKFAMGINSSGWCIWRGPQYLPDDLVFHDPFLASNHKSVNINTSRPSIFNIGLYYKFLRNGIEDQKKLISKLQDMALYLTNKLHETGYFKIISNRDRYCLPLVAFRLKEKRVYTEFDIATKLKDYGWIIPAYFIPSAVDRVSIMRIVVQEDFKMAQADYFTRDITHIIQKLDGIKRVKLVA